MKKFGIVLKNISRSSKRMIDVLELLMTGKGTLADELVDAGVLNYRGQGKDEYGR